MQVNNKNITPTFCGGGKPLNLSYILLKHNDTIPTSVRNVAQKLINEGKEDTHLIDIHRKIYAPLLDCKTIDDAKKLFPEFSDVLAEIPRPKTRKGRFRISIDNFGLKAIQEYWVNLKTKNELAKVFGLRNRGAIDYLLNLINFKGFKKNYPVLLKSSDPVGNSEIANKTIKWNAAHPEIRRELNIKAAHACKTPEYRAAHAERVKKYDKEHPERREKIAKASREMWDRCPTVKKALTDYIAIQPEYVRQVMVKRVKKIPLNDQEKITHRIFYKKFWTEHPELKAEMSRACKEAREERLKNKVNIS